VNGIALTLALACLVAAGSVADETPVDPLAFAAEVRLVAIVWADDIASAGFVRRSSNTPFRLQVGESTDGMELVEVDPAGEFVRIRRGAAEALLQMTGQVSASSPALSAAAVERLRMRQAQGRVSTNRTASTNRPPAKYEGSELSKHLSEYKLDVIRQGLPALPIPLTPEEDEQLVREGVLQPLDESPATPAAKP
jgi:hypothetical protein